MGIRKFWSVALPFGKVAYVVKAFRIGFRSQSQQNLVEFSQNLAEFGGLGRIWWNMAEYSRKRQIAVNCGSLVVGLQLLSRQKQVVVCKVLWWLSRNSTPPLNSSFYKVGLQQFQVKFIEVFYGLYKSYRVDGFL